MKCDEQRPQCSNCTAYNLQCDGYIRNIFFDTNEVDDGAVRYRQVLFTDTERQQMNQLMTSEVPLPKTNEVISAIEAACENDSTRSMFRRGPFGAFRLAQGVPRSPSPSLSALLRRTPSPSPIYDGLSDIPMTEWMEMPPLFDSGAFNFSPVLVPDNVMRDFSSEASETFDQWLISSEYDVPLTLSLDQAPLLLKHYSEKVISSFTPFRHAKTPWHILFLPNAKTTLASLAMGERVDHANLTVFYGILTVSALDLDASSSGGRWKVEASNLERKAQEHFAAALEHAFDQPKPFKYKSVVIAILVMVQIAVQYLFTVFIFP
jgi:arginine metabolism regulation protein II